MADLETDRDRQRRIQEIMAADGVDEDELISFMGER